MIKFRAYFKITAVVLLIWVIGLSRATAGLWQDVLEYPEGGCLRVPVKTACLSACAFAWLKGSRRINNGVLGFHLPYDMQTGNSGVGIRVSTRNFLEQYGGLHFWPDIARTTPRVFLILEGESMWIADWRVFEDYAVSSQPEALEHC